MATLPNLGDELTPITLALPAAVRPRFIALLERGAGARYRAWAAACGDTERARGLGECAAREERIATLVEEAVALPPGHDAAIAAAVGRAAEVAERAFGGRPLAEQFAIQAAGERRGASLWRALAEGDAARREMFLRCAALEEESAAFLETVVASG